MRLLRQFAPGFFLVGALLVTGLVGRYLTLNPEVYFDAQRAIYEAHPIALFCHVLGGMVALLLGPFQFMAGLRARFPRAHRVTGRLYAASSVTSSIAGLTMATRAFGGFPAGLGFGMLAVLWLLTIVMAVARARQRNFTAHREWVIRSFALTLAAVTLRIYLPAHGILDGTGVIDLDFIQMYRAVAWLCWVPNLIVAEWYINASRMPRESIA